VNVEKFRVVGFKGRVAYVVGEEDETYQRSMEALLRYSAVSNIGAKTTYRLGVVRAKDLKTENQ